MSSSRYSAIRSLLSRLSVSTARPTPSEALDIHHNSASIDRSIDPYPGSPATPKDSAFASPTTTRAPSPIADLEHLPYIPSDAELKFKTPSAPADTPGKGSSQHAAQPQQTEVVVPRARPRLWCSFVIYGAIGWGDGVTGTALPYFQSEYHLDYTIVSLLFIFAVVGIFIGTFIFEPLFHLLGRSTSSHPSDGRSTVFSSAQGRHRLLCLAIAIHALFYALCGSRSGFASLVAAFIISGIGRAIMFGILNDYVAGLPSKPLGQLHGSWGVGGLVSPLICQTIISSGINWSVFYLISLAASAIAFTFAFVAFRPALEDALVEGRPGPLPASEDHIEKGASASSSPPAEAKKSSGTFMASLALPIVWAFNVLLFFSSGSETSTNGFIVTFLLTQRNANPKIVGYLASIFWAGFTISRVVIGLISYRLSFRAVKNIVHGLILSAMILNVCIWQVDSLVANVVFFGLIGLAIGPLFPTIVYLSVQLMPDNLRMVSVAIMTAAASLGTAILPFLSGVLSNNPSIGPSVLPKMLLGEYGFMLLIWFFFPSQPLLGR